MNNKFDYILELFYAIYSIDFPVEISYGLDGLSKIQISKGDTSFFDGDSAQPETVVWKVWNEEKIPFLFDGNDEKEIIGVVNGQVIINYDIIASSFFFLSGWQEYKTQQKDRLGRFPYSESIQYKLNLVELPLVNYYFDILKQALEQVYDKELKVKLWGDGEYGTFISHDIDLCESAWKQGSLSELARGRVSSPFYLLSKKLFSNDDWFNFDLIMELEKRHLAKSTFYFLCENKKVNNYPNADYDISDKKFLPVFDNILKNESELGIHGSLGTSNDAAKLKLEMRKIPGDIEGGRFHALVYDIHKTPDIIEEAGLKYDSTLGFAEHIGFRNSFCFPFFPYDIKNDQPYKFLEIPLMVMDATLKMKKYMGLTPDEAGKAISSLMREVRKFNGCFSILWHNNFYSNYKFSGWREIMEQVLQEGSTEGSRYFTGKEISDIYRSQMR